MAEQIGSKCFTERWLRSGCVWWKLRFGEGSNMLHYVAGIGSRLDHVHCGFPDRSRPSCPTEGEDAGIEIEDVQAGDGGVEG